MIHQVLQSMALLKGSKCGNRGAEERTTAPSWMISLSLLVRFSMDVEELVPHEILITLWLFNIAMENGPFIIFIDDVPIKTTIYIYSMAMLNNQMVNALRHHGEVLKLIQNWWIMKSCFGI